MERHFTYLKNPQPVSQKMFKKDACWSTRVSSTSATSEISSSSANASETTHYVEKVYITCIMVSGAGKSCTLQQAAQTPPFSGACAYVCMHGG